MLSNTLILDENTIPLYYNDITLEIFKGMFIDWFTFAKLFTDITFTDIYIIVAWLQATLSPISQQGQFHNLVFDQR